MTDDWDISYDIDDLIEPENAKKNMFAKTYAEITPRFRGTGYGFPDTDQYSRLGQYPLNNSRFDAEAHIEFMSPDEFLKKSIWHGSKTGSESDFTPEYQKIRNDDIIKYTRNARSGDKFPMPELRYDGDEYSGHSGRRRAITAKELGNEKIPVVIQKFAKILDPFSDPEVPNSWKNINKRKELEEKKQNPFTFETELI